TIWVGEVSVRHGLAERFDGGLRVIRTAGRQEIVSVALLEPKVEITAPEAQTAVSVALGLGAAWGERAYDFQDGIYVLSPSVLVGHRLGPEAELVVAPRF